MNNDPINPELVAAKIAAGANMEEPELHEQLMAFPRRLELMWFIQWKSFQPGGIAKFASDLIESGCIVTAAMRAAGSPGKDGKWTLAQALEAWKRAYTEVHHYHRNQEEAPKSQDFEDWVGFYVSPDLTAQAINRGEGCDKVKLLHGLERFNFAYFKQAAAKTARERLPGYLRDLCSSKQTHFGPRPTWFPEVVPAVLEFMERHAAEAKSRMAMTEIANQVFDALDYSWAARKLVRISGSARFGKTESVKTWCLMYPGRARLATVPYSNAESDLFCSVGDALGVSVSRSGREARAKIDYILKNARLGIVFDEAHFLFPVKFDSRTTPSRLNWLRTQVVDRGLPCALVCTPQSYDGQSARFVKATGYNMEQWTGRIALDVRLPDVLSSEDLMAVAKLHFGDFSEPLLRAVCGAAKHSENYLKAVEDIASRARWLAQRRNASAVGLCDLEGAIRDVVPGVAAALGGHGEGNASNQALSSPRRRRVTAAEVLRDTCDSGRRIDLRVNPAPAQATGMVAD